MQQLCANVCLQMSKKLSTEEEFLDLTDIAVKKLKWSTRICDVLQARRLRNALTTHSNVYVDLSISYCLYDRFL